MHVDGEVSYRDDQVDMVYHGTIQGTLERQGGIRYNLPNLSRRKADPGRARRPSSTYTS